MVSHHISIPRIAPGAASPASDLYAVGTVFFELLTGRPPCDRIKEVFAARGLPCLPTELNPALPPEVDEVVALMCAFAPEERYESMAEAAEDLAIIG